MKRFSVVVPEGTMKLYYSNVETAKATWPGAISICEIPDTDHLPAIEFIKSHAENKGSVGARELYTMNTPYGWCEIKLHLDPTDSHYYDFLEYRLCNPYSLTVPILWDITTPVAFCEKFFRQRALRYVLISATNPGHGEKLTKPNELKGVSPIVSVPLYANKVRNQIFVSGNDVYIRCNDYFSPSVCLPDDIGTPLSYRAMKYCDKTHKEKFIYSDSWGDIVARRQAWMKFENFVYALSMYDDIQISKACSDMLRRYHRWKDELSAEWMSFFEQTARAIRSTTK